MAQNKKVELQKSKNNTSNEDIKIDVFSNSDNKIISIELPDAVHKLYYQEVRPATDVELKKSGSKYTSDQIKILLSKQNKIIPLYDVYTSNIYIIQRRNVYHRVINNYYRFPDEMIMKNIIKSKTTMDSKIKRIPDKKKDLIFMKKYSRTKLMIQFMEYFDLDVLFDTYLKVFYLYAPEISEKTYTCLRRSFIPHKDHLLPYYTKDEVIRLAMNNLLIKIPDNMTYQDYKDNMTKDDYSELCEIIQENDISADTLVEHQNYIIKNNAVGLVQYYTVQGSYFINQYMRQRTRYEYRNDYLEGIIDKMWRLILNAPSFDKDYTLYRFISDDSYLSDLKVGDYYADQGFTSTTRDPFYRTDLYQFGFILIKVNIPKDTPGVGLCLETLSHFANEEEIVLPPLAKLRLIKITDASDYYHPDKEFAAEVKKSYIFEWVSNVEHYKDKPLPFFKRKEYPNETKVINFLKLSKSNTLSLREKINQMMATHFDPMNRIKCNIGNNTFYVIGEYYDSTGPYKPMYGITSSEGFSLYSIYNGYMLFMIEIGEENEDKLIRVNYFSQYSELKRSDIMGDDNFIEFIASIAYYFDIPNVIIYADYHSCDHLDTDFKNTEQIGGKNKQASKDTTLKLKILDAIRRKDMTNKGKKQREFTVTKDTSIKKTVNYKEKYKKSSDNIDEFIDLEYTGGSYCLDFYQYLKNNVKRYSDTNTLNVELRPKFEYRDLDIMKDMSPSIILSKKDYDDEMYQIYKRGYLANEKETNEDTVAGLYIWMIENKCYLMNIFVSKLNKLFKKRNPFKKGYYILDSMTYLYNRNKVMTYDRFIKMNFDEDHQLLVIPKNEYRITRDRL